MCSRDSCVLRSSCSSIALVHSPSSQLRGVRLRNHHRTQQYRVVVGLLRECRKPAYRLDHSHQIRECYRACGLFYITYSQYARSPPTHRLNLMHPQLQCPPPNDHPSTRPPFTHPHTHSTCTKTCIRTHALTHTDATRRSRTRMQTDKHPPHSPPSQQSRLLLSRWLAYAPTGTRTRESATASTDALQSYMDPSPHASTSKLQVVVAVFVKQANDRARKIRIPLAGWCA
jgi:hypothetical protein